MLGLFLGMPMGDLKLWNTNQFDAHILFMALMAGLAAFGMVAFISLCFIVSSSLNQVDDEFDKRVFTISIVYRLYSDRLRIKSWLTALLVMVLLAEISTPVVLAVFWFFYAIALLAAVLDYFGHTKIKQGAKDEVVEGQLASEGGQ
ncbi:hypothetical protein AB4254_08265 [Vibrio breoganii]